MDQIHNHNSGSIMVLGRNYQSHYVPAEKPYAVYAFAWEGPTMAIAQYIGTMLTESLDKDGKVKFTGKAVYRMPGTDMLDFAHCFIPEDMGPLENDPMHIGFAGDTIGIDTLVKVVSMELKDTISLSVKPLIDKMRLAGLKVELENEYKLKDVAGCIDWDVKYEDNVRKTHYVIEVNDGIALRQEICDGDGKSVSPEIVLNRLWTQMKCWQEVGVTFEHIHLTGKYADYQDQVDELLELIKLYDKCAKMADDDFLLFKLLSCLVVIGKSHCSYDAFVMASKEILYGDDNDIYDKDLQMGIDIGYISRDGNDLQFMPALVRMATWKWIWLHD